MELYTYKAHCTNVVDGDTVDLIIDKGFRDTSTRRIRLKDIDTPERGQDGYTEAKEFLQGLLLDQECFIKSYKTGDFGRWVGVLYVEQEGIVNVNDLLVERGYAVRKIY